MDPLAVSLERKIAFLQQQHRDTLRELHSEIERLKRQNKDLQFKLIMEPPQSRRKGSSCKGQKQCAAANTFQSLKGLYMEQNIDVRLPQDANLSNQTQSGDVSEATAESKAELFAESKKGLITSLHPLRIHYNPFQPPRAPTLHECEIIIRQLYNANSLQSQELLRIKAVLRDIVLNKKITPENYILTKAYLTENKRIEESESFPKLPFHASPRGRPLCQTNMTQRVILPALNQSLSTSFAERQRRTRTVQRSRLRKTVT